VAKTKKMYVCTSCGADSSKWFGKCPQCGQWNTCSEIDVAPATRSLTKLQSATAPVPIRKIEHKSFMRIDTHFSEVNRVLGGGIVPASVILLAGDPGIGKSTLALQIALSLTGHKVLYVSGEESAEQIKLRADRIGIANDDCYVYSETLLENILRQTEEFSPDLVIVDSIQTIYTETVDSSASSVSQVRECASQLLRYAKQSGVPVVLIGHITKDGTIAGPKVLEHIVDVVLQFEGENNLSYRILRGVKNRFGATSEIGVFCMESGGLQEVLNPSEILVSHYTEPLSGVAIGVAVDGQRPYLIETQALASASAYGTPQRSSTGYDYKRMNILVAVLEKRMGFAMGQKDIFLNLAGGLKVSDPGLDLALAASIISSVMDIPIDDKMCFAGEIGLSGEVRPASVTQLRIAEAARLGFKSIVVSGYYKLTAKDKSGINIITINKIGEIGPKIFSKK